ncbi:NADP-dependent alcohol dehydrogenase C [Lachnellula suecica]|uniref:NADP-dependent alcohol dehydrogenase C n=1 Tax=Lachnellula suecica TaxID=602035 RepID=A0A8T9CG40_9HELO|nr:NADP-dependent alcohol dehydrogenase C [Lachnellula suecica]
MQSVVYRGIEGAGKKGPLELPAELGPKEILLKRTYANLCGADVHYLASGADLGHEGVGIVENIGSAVTQFKIGDRAGAGYIRHRSAYGEKYFNTGTFGDYYAGHETYVHKIPDNLPSEFAAPLQCAGATTYSAIIKSAKPSDRVGILGIGGLGHLAIQYSAKLGYETVVFSSSADKEAEAKFFGATEFYLLSEPETTIVPLSAPNTNIELPSWPVFFDGYKLQSSLVASRQTHDDMLVFSAHHQITPTIEKFEFSEEGFAEAVAKLKSGKLRYRGVLVA